MTIQVKAFGIARDIFSRDEMTFDLPSSQNTVQDLKVALVRAYPEFEKLTKFSIAVNQEYRDDNFQISENDEVVIIPPVSGG